MTSTTTRKRGRPAKFVFSVEQQAHWVDYAAKHGSKAASTAMAQESGCSPVYAQALIKKWSDNLR